MPGPAAAPLLAMAGVLRRADGCVLLTERPVGKHLAGFWEFPGGKLEPGETPLAGLARELHEELGIAIGRSEPLLRLPWRYGDLDLLLDTWIVHDWVGEPHAREGQAMRWSLPSVIDSLVLAPADREILRRLG